jgi:metal-responsive CopG/Arc/MetJ family transcriptional regulator
MTSSENCATMPTVGRKKLFPVRITLPLTAEIAARLDRSLKDKEARLDLIREAIERELERREAKPKK